MAAIITPLSAVVKSHDAARFLVERAECWHLGGCPGFASARPPRGGRGGSLLNDSGWVSRAPGGRGIAAALASHATRSRTLPARARGVRSGRIDGGAAGGALQVECRSRRGVFGLDADDLLELLNVPRRLG